MNDEKTNGQIEGGSVSIDDDTTSECEAILRLVAMIADSVSAISAKFDRNPALSQDYTAFVRISDARAALAAAKKAIDTIYNTQSVRVAERLCDEGYESVRIDGRTVHIREDRFPKIICDDRAAAVEALASYEATTHLVAPSVNMQTLRSAMFGAEPVFEHNEDGDPIIPDELREYIGYDSRITARVGAASNR